MATAAAESSNFFSDERRCAEQIGPAAAAAARVREIELCEKA